MSAARFPAGSVRAAVTAFGDAWTATFIGPSFECPAIRAELADDTVMDYCGELVRQDRRASMEDRAFIWLDRDDIDDESGTPVVIYGPQGSGKTLHAERLRAHFHKARVLDDWRPGDRLPGDALALTSQPDVPGAIALEDALAALAGSRS